MKPGPPVSETLTGLCPCGSQVHITTLDPVCLQEVSTRCSQWPCHDTHTSVKKTHDLSVEQLYHWPLPHNHEGQDRLKKIQVSRSRGQRYGDIEPVVQLADTVGPVNLVMDPRIPHDRLGSTSNPILNDHLHYQLPSDIDNPVEEKSGSNSDTMERPFRFPPFNTSSVTCSWTCDEDSSTVFGSFRLLFPVVGNERVFITRIYPWHILSFFWLENILFSF